MVSNVVVLIADIVASREIENRRNFQRNLKDTLTSINTRSKKSHLSPLTLTLGDEFQGVYRDLTDTFPELLEIMSSIHPVKIRTALACGRLSTDINPEAALEMDGEAFVMARELMTRLKKSNQTVIEVSATELPSSKLINICLRLLSAAITGWKSNTLQIFHGLMKNIDATTIAGNLRITKRAVDKQIAVHRLRDYKLMLTEVADELNNGLKMKMPDTE